ncbi:MAG TPA: hydroxymethylglutaryl-CoA reductase [Vicinamibacterales bacterium]|jgi:hydroxymethylglutaryl-CoA reductase (NADPH)
MPTDYRRATDFLKHALGGRAADDLARLRPRTDPMPPRVPGGSAVTTEAIDARWALAAMPPAARDELADARTIEQREAYARSVENFVGTVKVPVGLAGPLRVNGLHATGDYYVPLATTEAALVASYSRGAQVVTEAGGCAALLLNEGVSRAPGFAFDTLGDAAHFAAWAATAVEHFKAVAEATSRYGRLLDMGLEVEGNHVYLEFVFTTGDAAGQNMVTIATEAICRAIVERAPVRPRYWFVEANLSGDKKATTHSFMSVRGKKVAAEVVIPAALLADRLHTTAGAMIDYWRMSALGGVMSGSIGVHGHYANGLAALFIACGQDAACVAEAAVGVTRFEPADAGGLYAAVTLPNVIVGTVGGGTRLPSQHACLDILGLNGADCARAFAELIAALSLAGELSITAALAAGQFTEAHHRLARGPATETRT